MLSHHNSRNTFSGSETDERGNSRPVAFMKYRVNGQYIMEGLAASFMFTLGGMISIFEQPYHCVDCKYQVNMISGVGFILLDVVSSPTMPKLNRLMLTGLGFACVLIAFFATRVFMRMKLPGYMLN